MFFSIGLLIFLIIAFRVNKNNKRAYNAFIAESAADKKQAEINYFWNRIKSAKTSPQREEVIASQSSYWFYYRKVRIGKFIAFFSLVIGLVIEWLVY